MEKIERSLIDESKSTNEKLKVMGVAFIIGLLFNYFFIWNTIGISAVIYNGFIIAGAIWYLYPQIDLKKRISFIFLIPIILLSIAYSIYTNEILRLINTIVIPLLMASYIITIRYEHIKDIKFSFIEKVLVRIVPASFVNIPKFFVFTKKMITSEKNSKVSEVHKNIFKGLIVALPLLLIIVGLLSSADMVFEYYIDNMGKKLDLFSVIGHSMVVIITTLYMFGFLWSFQYKKELNTEKKSIQKNAIWEPVTIITIIFLISIVYLLFTIIQISYLYGGGSDLLPGGLSHAAYARKGFFELIVVTLINFSIVLSSMTFSKKDNKNVNKIANGAYSLLILFTFNMLASASYKMMVYENKFGFTRLRLFVQVFMILLAILLVIIFLGIWIKKMPILKLAIIATITIYVGINFVNVDKVIAKNNIERYKNRNVIDMDYLESLSYDATEEIGELMKIGDGNIKIRTIKYINRTVDEVDKSYNQWYEYNYYKHKILAVYKK
ncbi:DUF4173 domain-containing protein [Lutibacter sp. B2]|nr:DUF4173 domain-containing protein [Lutibacter sp. B2]